MIRFSKTYPSFLTVKEGIFLKSSRPSLPLKKASPLISVFFNSLYDPFGSPYKGTETSEKKRKALLLSLLTVLL
jgi:hypothetical protein